MILLEDPAIQQKVEAALIQRNIPVVTYLTPLDLTACTTFLSHPQGALITSGRSFQGWKQSLLWWSGAGREG